MEWVAEYDDGHAAHERDHGSLQNVPDPQRVVQLWVGEHALPIPTGATLLWLRRVSINVASGQQTVNTMIGWARDDERVEVWVDDAGNVMDITHE